MHRGMQWPEPKLTWPDGKRVCCTFRPLSRKAS
jgi:hypothetical protein